MKNARHALIRMGYVVILIACVIGTSRALPVDDTSTFVQIQNQWAQARMHADIAFLEKFYAKEFTVGTIDGAEVSREEDIAKFASGDLKPTVINDDEIKVHRYGDAAIVTGTEHLEGTYKGYAGQFDLRFANFYIIRDGRWQLVRHQATPMRKKPVAASQ